MASEGGLCRTSFEARRVHEVDYWTVANISCAPERQTDYTNWTALLFWSMERSYFGICIRPNYRGCPCSALETGSAGEIPHPISQFNLSPDPPTKRGSTDFVTALPRKNGRLPGLTFLRFTEAWVPSRLGRNSRCGTLVTSYP